METILDELKEWGCDIEGAMARFLDDTELYLTCLDTVVTDSAFVKLGEALAERDVKVAFDSAHTLKGVFANMGLTPMLRIVECIVEPLRDGIIDDLMNDYHKLLEMNEFLKDILERNDH